MVYHQCRVLNKEQAEMECKQAISVASVVVDSVLFCFFLLFFFFIFFFWGGGGGGGGGNALLP